jgi:L-2-hydroxyglutarate oxidase LhgO
MREKYDHLIVGGGIVGLSVGLELLIKYPNARVLLVDKEERTGVHASGRNSGVLHAGFYYSPDSLKAKFCLQGNLELREIIAADSIPLNECGKVVVAQNEEDLERLEALFQRGITNGVNLELLPEADLARVEPLAKTYKKFLWSPMTAVSNPEMVTESIKSRFLQRGGQIRINASASFNKDGEVSIDGQKLNADNIINAAGTGAIHLAHSAGVGHDYSQLPVLGLYKITLSKNLPLSRLVYPVPNPKNPFLGVHFTLTVDGSVKIGPTAIPVLGREQYSLQDMPDLLDIRSSFSSLFAMIKDSPKNLLNLAVTELPKVSLRVLTESGALLVPSSNNKIVWNTKKPGMRAQLVNLTTGKFEMDYVVRKHNNQVHILNAVSPGWTSSIPFARWIISEYL